MISENVSAFIAYIPVIGWLYVLFFQQKNPLAMFHVRQSIGLFAFLAVMLGGWFLVLWVLSWLPFGVIFGVGLFTLVISAFVFGVFVWVMGIVDALNGRARYLPIFGRMASRIPF
jgi:uncharacterized membrane protein